ncbi:MAG: aminotransferase class I/II-fold pyridoxal phosphate-dependent enzyme, partial [Devosiaceae bacterium]|nr:aminotransferase class I/II-fold pyridoxal phosphate-dependent enzyme [Devosiaceae bacterium MH13]
TRYALADDALDPDTMVMPLSGSREGLVFAARCARDLSAKTVNAERPVIVMQNPFYQAYAAGALAADCDVILLDEDDVTGERLPADALARTIAAYVASPTNPQGVVLSEAQWQACIARARAHDFFLFADECYSEIYRSSPPPGALEAAAKTGTFDKVIAFNSLSKRSNLPGLRTGFAAGDPVFLSAFMKLRNMGGPQVPTPLQAVAAMAWGDEAHVDPSRVLYAQKWDLVEALLGAFTEEPLPEAGFFLWLNLPHGITDTGAAITLWRDHALRTIPGSFIAYPHPSPKTGADRLRLALVDDLETTAEALRRLASFLSDHPATQNQTSVTAPITASATLKGH